MSKKDIYFIIGSLALYTLLYLLKIKYLLCRYTFIFMLASYLYGKSYNTKNN